MDITLKWTGNLAASLREITNRLLGTRTLLETLARRVRYTMQLNILQSRTPDGEPFAPLVLPIRKKVRKLDPRPLLDSGNLVNSFAYKFVGEDTIQVGDPTRYGIFHEFGTKHVPSRSFIGIRPDDQAVMQRYVKGWTSWAFGVYDADTTQLLLDFENP